MKRPLCYIAVVFCCILFFLELFLKKDCEGKLLVGTTFYQEKDSILLEATLMDYETKEQYEKTITQFTLKNIYVYTSIPNQEEHFQTQSREKQKISKAGQTIICQAAGEQKYPIGTKLFIQGKISFFRQATNPGEFNAADFYKNRDVLFIVKQSKILGITKRYCPYQNFLFQLKQRNEEQLARYLPPGEAAILKAMLFSDKTELSEAQQVLYQKNGIAHILAISGLHISLLGMALYKLLKRCYCSNIVAGIISELFLLSYGIMVGFGASSFRAIFMFSLFLIAKSCKRSYDMLSAMSGAGLLLMLLHPAIMKDCAFLLSFLAIWAMGALLPSLQQLFLVKNKLFLSLLASGSVFMTTAPVLIYFYHELSFGSVLLNLIVIPCMSVLLLSAIVLLIASYLFTPLMLLLRVPIHVILLVYQYGCIFLDRISFLRRNIEILSIRQLLFYYFSLIIVTITVNTKRKRVGLFVAVVSIFIALIPNSCEFSVTFLDVSQGDCAVIQTKNHHTYLIDGGSSTRTNIGENVMIPFLKSEGVSTIQGIFLSHPDEDHMNGIIELLKNEKKENFTIQTIYLTKSSMTVEKEKLKELFAAAREYKITVSEFSAGQKIYDNDVSIECLYPDSQKQGSGGNASSMVLLLRYGEFQTLFTGDMEMDGEQALLEKYDLSGQQIECLKVSHHGSKYSTSEEFLEELQPKYAIISSGISNFYGHPHKELLQRLEDKQIPYIRTDQKGAVCIKSDGKEFKIGLVY